MPFSAARKYIAKGSRFVNVLECGDRDNRIRSLINITCIHKVSNQNLSRSYVLSSVSFSRFSPGGGGHLKKIGWSFTLNQEKYIV